MYQPYSTSYSTVIGKGLRLTNLRLPFTCLPLVKFYHLPTAYNYRNHLQFRDAELRITIPYAPCRAFPILERLRPRVHLCAFARPSRLPHSSVYAFLCGVLNLHVGSIVLQCRTVVQGKKRCCGTLTGLMSRPVCSSIAVSSNAMSLLYTARSTDASDLCSGSCYPVGLSVQGGDSH